MRGSSAPLGYAHKIMISIVALDIRDERLDLARVFGAEYALNPRRCDPVREVEKIIGGKADVVIEASGAPGTLDLATFILKHGGKLVISGRHVIDERIPLEKWHTFGFKVFNISPSSSRDFNRDFHDAVKLLRKGVFDQSRLITHKFKFECPEVALRVASEKPPGYIKGVIVF